ncbi:MAG: RHS repeat-associated core domain-containing protein [Balneolaceae bacterium]
MKKLFLLFLILIPFFSELTFAQDNATMGGITVDNSSEFFGGNSNNIPFSGDLNWGIPLISLPGLEGYDYSINIQHSSSMMHKQHAAWVGYGWTLKTGDITRTVVKRPDEQHVSMFGAGKFMLDNIGTLGGGTYPIEYDDIETRNGMFYDDRENEEWDTYMLNLPGSSEEMGVVTYGADAKYNHNGSLVTLPHYIKFSTINYKPYDIRWTTELASPVYTLDPTRSMAHKGFFQGFRVVNGSGYAHYFDEIENIELSEYFGSGTVGNGINYKYPSAWKLKKIKSPYSENEINFTYYSNHKQRFSRQQYEVVLGEYRYGSGVNSINGEGYLANVDYDNKYPDIIESETHKLKFIISDRYDHADDNWTYAKKLDEIRLIEKSTGRVIKKVVFIYDYSTTKRYDYSHPNGTAPGSYENDDELTLRSIQILDMLGNKSEYSFEYNHDDGAFSTIPDVMGYQAGGNALWKIKTPSGSITEFDYELNRRVWDYFGEGYLNPQTYNGYAEYLDDEIIEGGIRLKSKKITDGMGNDYTTSYTYGDGVLSVPDFLSYKPTRFNYSRKFSGSIQYRWIGSTLPDGSKIINHFTNNISLTFIYNEDEITTYEANDGTKIFLRNTEEINIPGLDHPKQEEVMRSITYLYGSRDNSNYQGQIYQTEFFDPNNKKVKDIKKFISPSELFLTQKYNDHDESVISYPATSTNPGSIYPRRHTSFGWNKLEKEVITTDSLIEVNTYSYKEMDFPDTYQNGCSPITGTCGNSMVATNDLNYLITNLYNYDIPFPYEPNYVEPVNNLYNVGHFGRMPISLMPHIKIKRYVNANHYSQNKFGGLDQLGPPSSFIRSIEQTNFAIEMYKNTTSSSYRDMYDMNMRNQVYSKSLKLYTTSAHGLDLKYDTSSDIYKIYSTWEYYNDAEVTGNTNFVFNNKTKWRSSKTWQWNGVSDTETITRGNGTTGTLDIIPDVPTTSNSIKISENLSFDGFGNVLESVDANGVKTSYKYTNNGQHLIGSFTNAEPDEVFTHSFAYDGLTGWTKVDNGNDGDTEFSIIGGKLRLKNFAAAQSGEVDRIYYNLGAEIQGNVLIEFDVTIANSNNWDLIIAAGGSSWSTGNGGSENAIWTAINNEQWRIYYNNTWHTVKSGLEVGKTYRFKILVKSGSNQADFYVNGEKVYSDAGFRVSSSGIQKVAFGNYGYGTVDTEWFIDNFRMYPEDAQAITQEIDPLTLGTLAVKKVDGVTERSSISGLGANFVSSNPNGTILNISGVYNSKEANSNVFDTSAPHKAESISFQNILFSTNFSHKKDWTVSSNSNIDFGEEKDGVMAVRMSSGFINSTKYIERNSNSENLILSTDFYPEANLSGLQSIMFKNSDSSNLYSIEYNTSNETFRVKLEKNGSGVSYYNFNIAAPAGKWYTIQIQKIGSTLYSWVYPKGTARNENDKHSTGSFSTSWEPIVRIVTESDNPFWLSNFVLAGSATVSKKYYDALGRNLQNQVSSLDETILTGILYDDLSRSVVTSKPVITSLQNTFYTNLFGSGFSGPGNALPTSSLLYSYYLGLGNSSNDSKYAYNYTKLESSLLSRPENVYKPGQSSFLSLSNTVQLGYQTNDDVSEEYAGFKAGDLRKNIIKDEDGNVSIQYVDIHGKIIVSGTDMNGNGKLERSSSDLVTSYEYDLQGSLAKVTDPNGYETTYSYNILGQLVSKKLPDQDYSVDYKYDKAGNLRFARDANHKSQQADLSVSLSGNASVITSFTRGIEVPSRGKLSLDFCVYDLFYDDYYFHIQNSDTHAIIYSDTFSTANNGGCAGNSTPLTFEVEPGAYHFHGEATDSSEPIVFSIGTLGFISNDVYTYTKYDDLGRPVETGEYSGAVDFASANANSATFPTTDHQPNIKYYYDGDHTPFSGSYVSNHAKGQLTKVSYRDLSTTSTNNWGHDWFSYNELGLVEWKYSQPYGLSAKLIRYHYDGFGRLTRRDYQPHVSGERFITWQEYDELGRLKYVYTDTDTNPAGRIKEAEYSYMADGQVDEIKLGSTYLPNIQNKYNIRGLLSRRTHTNSIGVEFFRLQLGYTANGNVSNQAWGQFYQRDGDLFNYTYSYDAANRLKGADFSGNGYHSKAYDVGYGYDKNGNMSWSDRYDDTGTWWYKSGSSYIYSNSNRIQYFEAFNTAFYSMDYDANGNMIENEHNGFESAHYDWRNLPSRMMAGGSMLTYAYNADGQRTKKKMGSTETHYVRDTDGKVLAVYVNDNLEYQNTYASVDLIGSYDGNERRYYHKDHIGSIRLTVDEFGNVDGYDDYYPFGLTMPGRSSNSANPNDSYKFTGHERDDEANLTLDYMGARYYDPLINRFLSIDPYAAKFPNVSPYVYALNNPIMMIDPDGRAATNCCDLSARYIALQRDAVAKGKDPVQYIEAYHSAAGENTAKFSAGVASLFIPGPEDAAIGIFAATKAGQAIARFGDEAWGAVKGLFRSGDEGLSLSSSVSDLMGDSYKAIDEVTVGIKNEGLLGELNKASEGDWVKVYEAGIKDGKKVETHYFRNNDTNEVFDVKQKYDKWHQKEFKNIEVDNE